MFFKSDKYIDHYNIRFNLIEFIVLLNVKLSVTLNGDDAWKQRYYMPLIQSGYGYGVNVTFNNISVISCW